MPRYLLPEISMPVKDMDVLTAKADALGIKYRADIKYSTLEARVAAHEVPAATEFKNNSTNNIFTSKGKVSPGSSVEIDADEAKSCGLE